MAEAYSPSITNLTAKSNLAVNLDVADRAQIVTACLVQLYNSKRTAEMSAWRKAAADFDFPTLLLEAHRLGVRFMTGGKTFELPVELVARPGMRR